MSLLGVLLLININEFSVKITHLSGYLLFPQGTQSSQNNTQASTCLWLCESLVDMVLCRQTLAPDKVKHSMLS